MSGFAAFGSTQLDPRVTGETAPEAAPPAEEGNFSRGLRRGGNAALGQLNTLAGGVGEALGADQFAQGRYGAARQNQADAEAIPGSSTWQDVVDSPDVMTGLRRAGSFVAGTAGEMVPAGAAMLAGGALGGIPGTVAATVPFSAGESLQRQMADPVAAKASPGLRLATAGLTSVPAAAAMSVGPGLVAKGVMGPVAKSFGGIAAHGAADALAMGGGMAANEAIQQAGVKALNPDKPFDPNAIEEAGIGGLAAGIPLAGAGVAAQAVKRAVGAPIKAAGDLAGKGKGKDEVASTLTDPVDKLRAITDPAKAKATEFWSRVANAESVADLSPLKGLDTEQVKAMMPKLDEERVAAVKAAGEELISKAGLTPERRDAIAQAMQNITDPASQAVIGAAKNSWEASRDFGAKAKKFMETFVEDAKVKAAEGKKSEDYSGIRDAIAEHVIPVLERTNPGALDNPEATRNVVEGVRLMLRRATVGGKDALANDQLRRMIEVFGADTGKVLGAVYKAVGDPENKAQSEAFFGTLNRVGEIQQRDRGLVDTMGKNLKPELQDSVKMTDLQQQAEVLREWARSNLPEQEGMQRTLRSEEARFKESELRAELEKLYGDKIDKVLEAVQKDVKAEHTSIIDSAEIGTHEAATMKEHQDAELAGKTISYGRGPKNDELTLAREHDPLAAKGQDQASQALARANKENPDRTNSFKSAAELGEKHPSVQTMSKHLTNHFSKDETLSDVEVKRMVAAEMKKYGMVTSEGTRNDAAITRNDLPKVLLRKEDGATPSSHYKNAARLDAGGHVVDARKLTKYMNERQQTAEDWAPADNKSRYHRLGRMFMDGVAALQDHLGQKFEVPDHTVIARIGKNDVTYGEVKKLDYSPPNKTWDKLNAKIEKLREEYKAEKDPENKAAIREEVARLIDENKTFDPREIEQFKTGFDPDPFGNIHALGNDVEPIKTNMTGNSRPVDEGKGHVARPDADHPSGINTKHTSDLLREKFEAMRDNQAGAGAKRIAEQGLALLDIKDKLNGSAKKALAAMLTEGTKASDVASTIKALSEKYQAALEVAAAEAPKASRERVDKQAVGPRDTKAAADYLNRTLNKVRFDLKANIEHAGDYKYVGNEHFINVSRWALNPLAAAHHESLHGYFAELMKTGNGEVANVLQRFASSAPILNQLKRLLANEPEALKQLRDPEEAAAYAYQFWQAGKLQVGDQAQTIFGKIAKYVRKALGIWSNDERAIKAMDFLASGDFKASSPGAVGRALIEAGHNKALEKAKSFTKPITNLSDALATAGGQRMRDTGIPALKQLADAMKLNVAGSGEDAGFIPAARTARTRFMNDLADKLAPYTRAQMDEAQEAMQRGERAMSAEARVIQRIIQHPDVGLLPKMLKYMADSGVDVSGIKDDPSYYPRLWDTGYIAAHQGDFLQMLEKYKRNGTYAGDPKDLMYKLMATEGSEFAVKNGLETDKPGMQFLKQRLLSFIDPKDAAPFVRKDMVETMNSYVTQATRRGEWAKRFGDKGEGIGKFLADAKAQGATPEQIEGAQKFVRAVDGTLGDTMDPNLRRLSGNAIVYQNIRLLPLMIFSSLVDPNGIMVRGGTAKEALSTLGRGIREMADNFKSEPRQADAATRLAQDVGTIDNAILMDTIGASYSQGMVGNTGRMINDKFFKYNLGENFNRSMRIGATQAAVAFLARHADGTASKHSARYMEELGFQVGEYKAGDVTSDKARMAINRWVDSAVLRPDAADKPLWMSDPHYAIVAHLKQFVYSFHENILKRVAHEARNGNYSPAMALASYVPVMIAADAMKGMIQGGGDTPEWKQNWGVGDYVWNGVQRGGLLGIGQFAADVGEDLHRGGTGFKALAGPTINQMAEGVQTLGGHEKATTLALHSAPANALYSGFVKGGGEPDPMFAD